MAIEQSSIHPNRNLSHPPTTIQSDVGKHNMDGEAKTSALYRYRTYRRHQIPPLNHYRSYEEPELQCELCRSHRVAKTPNQYVCLECGCVLETPVFRADLPSNKSTVHHPEMITRTTIGSFSERIHHHRSERFSRWRKLQRLYSNEERVLSKALTETCRLLSGMKLPLSFKWPILRKVMLLRARFSKGSRYRNPLLLIPVLLYAYCKKQGIPLDERKLVSILKISQNNFRRGKLTVLTLGRHRCVHTPDDKKAMIKRMLWGLSEEVALGMDFYYDTLTLLNKLYGEISCTKDSVIAAVVASLALLCRHRDKATVNRLCRRLNVRMSTVQSRVKRHIIRRYHVPEFESLVKSADIVKATVYRLGIFENSKRKEEFRVYKEEEKPSEELEIEICPKIIHLQAKTRTPSRFKRPSKRCADWFVFSFQNQLDLQPIFITFVLPYHYSSQKYSPTPKKPLFRKVNEEMYHSKGPPAIK